MQTKQLASEKSIWFLINLTRPSHNLLSNAAGVFFSIIMQSHLVIICSLRAYTAKLPAELREKCSSHQSVCWFLYIYVFVRLICICIWICNCFCCFVILSSFCVSLSVGPAGEQRDRGAKRAPFSNSWNSDPERGARRPKGFPAGAETVQLPATVRRRPARSSKIHFSPRFCFVQFCDLSRPSWPFSTSSFDFDSRFKD